MALLKEGSLFRANHMHKPSQLCSHFYAPCTFLSALVQVIGILGNNGDAPSGWMSVHGAPLAISEIPIWWMWTPSPSTFLLFRYCIDSTAHLFVSFGVRPPCWKPEPFDVQTNFEHQVHHPVLRVGVDLIIIYQHPPRLSQARTHPAIRQLKHQSTEPWAQQCQRLLRWDAGTRCERAKPLPTDRSHPLLDPPKAGRWELHATQILRSVAVIIFL